MDYATNRNLRGLMIWALDLDDDADTLLNLVSSAGLCSGGSGDKITYKCVPIDDVRWWTPENSDENRQGQCGKSAPFDKTAQRWKLLKFAANATGKAFAMPLVQLFRMLDIVFTFIFERFPNF
ncbi:GH18 domain-containing protein [Caenorhabditis elegans]|uniref:GH18 domain-containing protein n=1 Tax=Caenorhabditis elegans TaxID=6239 RepID=Q4PIS9_CAEEL|nr:GH18 domain-containing protein [Caenorhabditis elegans]CCD83398.1 GH18 domain-containing protein [Caenorhabditis elegans]|eukprot:NP_001033501.1 Uncharacterized protein CELE_T01C4.8 [Caenorhabditis elegans]